MLRISMVKNKKQDNKIVISEETNLGKKYIVARNNGKILTRKLKGKNVKQTRIEVVKTAKIKFKNKPIVDDFTNVSKIQFKSFPRNVKRFQTYSLACRFEVFVNKTSIGRFWGNSNSVNTKIGADMNELLLVCEFRAVVNAFTQNDMFIGDTHYKNGEVPPNVTTKLLEKRWVVFVDIKDGFRFR